MQIVDDCRNGGQSKFFEFQLDEAQKFRPPKLRRPVFGRDRLLSFQRPSVVRLKKSWQGILATLGTSNSEFFRSFYLHDHSVLHDDLQGPEFQVRQRIQDLLRNFRRGNAILDFAIRFSLVHDG